MGGALRVGFYVGVNVIGRMLCGEVVAVFEIAKSCEFGARQSNRVGISSIRRIGDALT